jgi:hypothetical protein
MQVELQQLDLRYGALVARDRRGESRAVAVASQSVEGAAVVVVAEGDRFVVVEGFERVRALQRLGQDTTQRSRVPRWTAGRLFLASSDAATPS